MLNLYEMEEYVEGSIDLRNDLIRIKNQGQRNTCSVFAATALVEYLVFQKNNQVVDLS